MRAKLFDNPTTAMDKEAAALDRMIEFAVEQAKSIGLAATSDLLMMARKSVHDSRAGRRSEAESILDEAMCSHGLH